MIIKHVGLIDSFRHLYAKLVGTLTISGIEFGCNLITPSECVWSTPCKRWFHIDLICYNIFVCNKRVYFLEIIQWSVYDASPSFYLTRNFHPFFIQRMCLLPFLPSICISFHLTVWPSFRWLIIYSNRQY